MIPEMFPEPEKNAGLLVKHATMTYCDGSSRDVYYTDSEYLVPNGVMIVSRTDVNGFIESVNPQFLEASGYSKDEVIGMPHYFLRHPDMPKAAFEDFWRTLKAGDTWSGAVKNLRKDGGFYWVQAVVKPMLDEHGKVKGYHSVRKRLERAKIKEMQALYDTMRAEEG